MKKIICIANQKGGVGKTTTAINLSASLATAEKKTLLIDCDSQANATSGMGIDQALLAGKNFYHALIGDLGLKDAIVPTVVPHMDMVPCNRDLIGVEVEFIQMSDREKRLRMLLQDLDLPYDYVIIDCPPSLGFLTVNALVASDYLIVPLQCEYFAMEGLNHLLNTMRLIKVKLNPSLTLAGILLTMYDTRNSLSKRVGEDVRKYFGRQVFNTVIPRNVRLSESPSYGLPIILYDIKSRGAVSYMELAQELLTNGRL